MEYQLPDFVKCSRCETVKQSARLTHLNRIFKIMIKLYKITDDEARSIPLDDERFQTAKLEHDQKYLCKKCRGPYKKKKVKIPVLLSNGEETTDYYDAFPEEFHEE